MQRQTTTRLNMKHPKLSVLMAQARDGVKKAGNLIADAHALCAVDNNPAREIIGHLCNLHDALYGLAIFCQHEVEKAEQAKPEAKKCFVVPTRERMAQEAAQEAETLCGPGGSRVPMTDADRKIEMKLRTDHANNPRYEWVWDAPSGSPDWEPVVGKIHTLSNGNLAYLFDKQVRQRVSEWERLKKHNNKVLDAVVRDAALKERIKQHLPAHKTCATWAETQCGLPLLTDNDPVSVLDWKRVTCKECLKLRGTTWNLLAGRPIRAGAGFRDKGIRQAMRAAKRKLVDTGDVFHRWVDPQPNHPSRFYLRVNGATKKRQAGNGYYTIEQARSLQKKLARPGVRVQVLETYLSK